MKRTVQIALVASLLLVAGLAGHWGWHHFQAQRLEPRYAGKPIGEWFPHWWRKRPPSAPTTYNGPVQAGAEAVPFLVRELDLEDLPEHRAYARISPHLPARWIQALPQPYLPRHHRPTVMLWLNHIVHRPGGPTAIANSSKLPGPISRRRLLHILGDARFELASVIPALAGALEDPDPAIRRVAGRSLLRLPIDGVEPVLPALLRTVSTDTGSDGIAAWSPLLLQLAKFRGHESEIRLALQPWMTRQVPEAQAALAALGRDPLAR